MRCRLRASAPAFRPHREGVPPKWHVVFLAFCVSSFLPFFKHGFRLKKRSNDLPERSPATSRPRCQGRVGFAVTGAQRTPLTEEAGGLGRSLLAGRALR